MTQRATLQDIATEFDIPVDDVAALIADHADPDMWDDTTQTLTHMGAAVVRSQLSTAERRDTLWV